MNIAKFVRTGFILKIAGTWEIHEDLQKTTKNYTKNEMRFKINSGRPRLSVHKDQNILIS